MHFIESISDLEQLGVKLLGSERLWFMCMICMEEKHPSQNKPLAMFLKHTKTTIIIVFRLHILM